MLKKVFIAVQLAFNSEASKRVELTIAELVAEVRIGSMLSIKAAGRPGSVKQGSWMLGDGRHPRLAGLFTLIDLTQLTPTHV